MTNACSGKRRYLALWFPFLPAERLRIDAPERFAPSPSETPPDAPLVLVTKVKGALRLAAVDPQAQTLGLTPGLGLADARARHPDLAVAELNEMADRRWLDRMTRRCNGWSPLVTPMPPDAIVLDIAGAAHLFGGETGLAAEVEETFAELGMTTRIAGADTAEAALALARYASLPVRDEYDTIRALPVEALGLEAEATIALRRAGLKCVGDVAVRPMATIAARFGADAVTTLRRLIGEEQAPIPVLEQPSRLRFDRRFAEPIGHQSAIAACFLELLRESALALEAKGQGGRAFRLTLERSDGVRQHLSIETGHPTRDPAPVLRLFDERIATLADPLDPGFGYDRIVLDVGATEPLAPSQPEFGGGEQAQVALADLVDRLSTRLGPNGLVRLEPRDSHIPEQAQFAFPAVHARTPVRWPKPPPGEPPLRPLFLFDPPQPVEVIAEVPDGPPHRFRWRRKLQEVRLYEGPERIAAEWWRRKGGELPGKGGLTRDYYRVEDVRGRRYWLFRHGLYEEKADPRWYLHGLFA